MQQSSFFRWPTLNGADTARFSRPPQLLQSLHHQHSGITALAIDPSETYLASASLDGTVAIWQLHSGIRISSYHHTGAVFGVAFGDHQRIVSGGEDKQIQVWNYATNQLLATLPTTNHIGAVAIDPTYHYLAAGINYDNTLELWDWQTLRPLKTIMGDYYVFEFVAFDTTGTTVRARLFGGENLTWELPTGALRHSFVDNHVGEWSYSAITPDTHLLATASEADDHVMLWDTQHGTKLQSIQVMVDGGPFDPNIALRWDGTILVSVTLDSQLRVWEPKTGTLLATCADGHDTEVRAITMSDSYVVTGDHDGVINLWHFQ